MFYCFLRFIFMILLFNIESVALTFHSQRILIRSAPSQPEQRLATYTLQLSGK